MPAAFFKKKADIVQSGLFFACSQLLKKRLTKNDVDVIKSAILCTGYVLEMELTVLSRGLGGRLMTTNGR
jgi:hypothetical protein